MLVRKSLDRSLREHEKDMLLEVLGSPNVAREIYHKIKPGFRYWMSLVLSFLGLRKRPSRFAFIMAKVFVDNIRISIGNMKQLDRPGMLLALDILSCPRCGSDQGVRNTKIAVARCCGCQRYYNARQAANAFKARKYA